MAELPSTRVPEWRERGIHTVKGFGIVNKAEIDVFLELSCFFDDPEEPLPTSSTAPQWHHQNEITSSFPPEVKEE